MGWEALGRCSSPPQWLFSSFHTSFFLWKLRQSLLLETTILSVRTPVTKLLKRRERRYLIIESQERRSIVRTPGTSILS